MGKPLCCANDWRATRVPPHQSATSQALSSFIAVSRLQVCTQSMAHLRQWPRKIAGAETAWIVAGESKNRRGGARPC